MKGATAVPWVSTIRPPNSAIMRIIGSSQYFLRVRMNCQSSATNDIGRPQNWSTAPGLGRRAGRLALHPPGRCLRIAPEGRSIVAESPHDQADRHDRGQVDQAQHHGVDHLEQEQPEPRPGAVQPGQAPGPDQSQDDKAQPRRGKHQLDRAIAVVQPGAHGGDQQQDAADGQTKAAIAAALDLLGPAEVLVRRHRFPFGRRSMSPATFPAQQLITYRSFGTG